MQTISFLGLGLLLPCDALVLQSSFGRRGFLRQAAGLAALASGLPATAEEGDEIDVYFGCGCFWHVQHEFVEAEKRILGRKVNGKGEELSWSIVIATKGLEGLVDVLLDSQEYLDAFGYDTVPFQRNRVLPGRELGDTPFNITTPRYDEYYRGILGFPQIVFMGGPGKALPARAKIKRGGAPADYIAWLKDLPMPNPRGNSTSTDIDYMSRVPFRSIGR